MIIIVLVSFSSVGRRDGKVKTSRFQIIGVKSKSDLNTIAVPTALLIIRSGIKS